MGIGDWGLDDRYKPEEKRSLEEIIVSKADNEEEAEASVLSGYYEEIVNDSEIGELEDPEVTNIEEV